MHVEKVELLGRSHDDLYLKILQCGETNEGYSLRITELNIKFCV